MNTENSIAVISAAVQSAIAIISIFVMLKISNQVVRVTLATTNQPVKPIKGKIRWLIAFLKGLCLVSILHHIAWIVFWYASFDEYPLSPLFLQ